MLFPLSDREPDRPTPSHPPEANDAALGLGVMPLSELAHQAPGLRYVEDKPLDLEAVGALLAKSQAINHWTNGGPVSFAFEEAIATHVGLSPDLRVVACSSATAALHALVSLHETLAGRDLRWAVSSFGYYSSVLGPLRSAEVVDCDDGAMLDLDQVDPDRVDGILVTNIFGVRTELDAYRAFAERHGLVLIVDAALALGSHLHGPSECVSFHHTKPWGFGEGGCAFVHRDHEALFRDLICFGSALDEIVNRRAYNGKLSDVASAFQIARLRQMEALGPAYRAQYARILELARQAGLEALPGAEGHRGIPANVPLLLPRETEDLDHPALPLGRYYHPLTEGTPKAWAIYRRIVNVPCHADLARLGDAEILGVLEDLRDR
jgi:dTDP-4-amino-4,6-dideoxygalactose transaminase